MLTVNDTLKKGQFKIVVRPPDSEAKVRRGQKQVAEIVKKPKTRMKNKSQVAKLNRALRSIHGKKTNIQIKRTYSAKSRVVRSSDLLKGVKLTNGQKGWLNIEGKFRTTQTYANLLHSVDSVAVADPNISLMQSFLNATPSQQFKIMNRLEGIDWEQFWVDWGDSPETGEYLEKQDKMYNQVVFEILSIVGESEMAAA